MKKEKKKKKKKENEEVKKEEEEEEKKKKTPTQINTQTCRREVCAIFLSQIRHQLPKPKFRWPHHIYPLLEPAPSQLNPSQSLTTCCSRRILIILLAC